MNVLDLFSGIGGFSLGLERAGMRTVAFCEQNPYCQQVLAKHWPSVRIFDDVRGLTAERLAATASSGDIAIDVICGGFPCQDISYAGSGAGIAGERSGLWSEFARLIGEIRPRFVIVENVAALLDRGMGVVLGDLAELGYDAEWDRIPAAAIGSRQLRERVFIIATPGSLEHSQRYTSRGLCGYEEFRRRTSVSRIRSIFHGTPWASEPGVDRVAYGIPAGSHRRSALGNTVIPQIIEVIGRSIMRDSAETSAIRKED